MVAAAWSDTEAERAGEPGGEAALAGKPLDAMRLKRAVAAGSGLAAGCGFGGAGSEAIISSCSSLQPEQVGVAGDGAAVDRWRIRIVVVGDDGVSQGIRQRRAAGAGAAGAEQVGSCCSVIRATRQAMTTVTRSRKPFWGLQVVVRWALRKLLLAGHSH